MLDLALGIPEHDGSTFFLVAPDARENDVRAQFARPAFARVSELDVRYIGYGELAAHRRRLHALGTRAKAYLPSQKRSRHKHPHGRFSVARHPCGDGPAYLEPLTYRLLAPVSHAHSRPPNATSLAFPRRLYRRANDRNCS